MQKRQKSLCLRHGTIAIVIVFTGSLSTAKSFNSKADSGPKRGMCSDSGPFYFRKRSGKTLAIINCQNTTRLSNPLCPRSPATLTASAHSVVLVRSACHNAMAKKRSWRQWGNLLKLKEQDDALDTIKKDH